MPVRSLNSSILKWPKRDEVLSSLKCWIEKNKSKNILKIGYFGSYAKGNYGVGSDLDLIIILNDIDIPFERRGILFDLSQIPVSVDLFVYTKEEYEKIKEKNFAFWKEIVWIF